MARINVACPCCCLHEVVKFGVSSTGKQRFQCKNNACEKNTFLLDYTHNARAPGVKDKIVDMAMNGSGVRDTAGVLRISINTVIGELKKRGEGLESVNTRLLKEKESLGASVTVNVVQVEEAELDEMWSFVRNKQNQRWLWHAIDHHTHEVLAYHFGPRKDSAFKALKEKLSSFDINFYYTDDWGAYERHLPQSKHLVGKQNTQAIERKHLTLRTRIKRLARKTICFSKLDKVHDIVIGLFINRHEFGRVI